MGLTVDVDGDFILCEDPGLDFERSHDGVRGISRWLVETREEYKMVIEELFEEDKDEGRATEFAEMQEAIEEALDLEEPEAVEDFFEDVPPLNVVEAQIQEMQDAAEEFAPAPPEKDHRVDQMALAKEMNMSDVAQAAEIDDQDRGGIVNPEGYILDMKSEAPAIAVLVSGQRFLAPEGWKIKEARPSGKVLFYGSVYQKRKAENEARGAEFSLVRL
jgi:hypothetical protein